MSVDDILAAARSGAKAKPAAKPSGDMSDGNLSSVAAVLAAARKEKGSVPDRLPAEPDGLGKSAAELLAAARTAKEGPDATVTPPDKKTEGAAQEMSVNDILAAARGQKLASTKEKPATEEPASTSQDDSSQPAAAKSPAPAADLPTDVAAIIDFCRKADAEG